jgi:hypothetical protein
LYSGITLAIFQSFGKVHEVIARLNIYVNELDIIGAAILMILFDILSILVACWLKV